MTRRLNALRKCGKRVVYLTGNRDYLLENIHPVPFDRLADAWDWTSAAGERFHFEHGDLINTADAAYLRWRSFSRSASTLGLFRQLPRAAQDAVARALQRKMAPTNRTYKAYEPEREMRRWAEDLVQRGYGGAVLGHFHRDVEITVAGLRIRMLPQFREDGAHLRIMGDGSWKLHRLR